MDMHYSQARNSPHMRTLATEFSNFIQHLNRIKICDRSHIFVQAYLANFTVECNKRTLDLQNAMSRIFSKLKKNLELLKCLFHNEGK